MNLGNLGKVETADTYLDIAFRYAKEQASSAKVSGDRFQKLQRKELTAINAVKNALTKHLTLILTSFPSFNTLDPFYRELSACVVDVAQIRQSLGGMNWALERLESLFREFHRNLRSSRTATELLSHKRGYYGRVSSVIKRLKDDFIILEDARKALKELPSIKTNIPTIVIAGFPNVGKSTLLSALTGSTPEIADYPFTTKQIMLGYRGQGKDRWQFIDTPGLLDRPLRERNKIELQAIAALKHLAKAVVFVLDPSESCGYPLDEQKRLLKDTAAVLRAPVIVALNKADLSSVEQLTAARERAQRVVVVSAEKKEGIDVLVKQIAAALA